MKKSMIVAYDQHRLIGRQGAIPWQGEQRADMVHFRKLTKGASLIMGRKTYESIGPGGLKDRQNIIVSHSGSFTVDPVGVLVVSSLEAAYRAALNPIMIIGGAKLYEATLADADVLYATEIHRDAGTGDAYFPMLSEAWIETSREDYPSDETNVSAYSFVTYTKQQ